MIYNLYCHRLLDNIFEYDKLIPMENELKFTKDLVAIGLSENEAVVYETLIYKGERQAGALKRFLPHSISRPMLYFILDKLVEFGLVVKKETKGKPASFVAEHPKKLESIIIKKQEELERSRSQFDAVIGGIVSGYNLQIGKPYVEFREGLEGAAKIMDDTLNSKEVIYTFVDTDMLEKYAGTINKNYVAKRKNKRISKKIIMVDSPLARQKAVLKQELTEIRLLPESFGKGFASTMNIYDGKIAYFTFRDQLVTSTLIHNQEMYSLNRVIFESLWSVSVEV
jgi:sugar-specific transcriptional regulator TrmB